MPTTTELTEKYIQDHPSIKDSLKKGIINYSKLSRIIAKDLDIQKKTSIEAILIACRRFEKKIKNSKALEDNIRRIVKNSDLEIKTKIMVIILNKKHNSETLISIEKEIRENNHIFYAIEGNSVFTIITNEKYYNLIKQKLKNSIIKKSDSLALINVKSSEDMEETPGIVAYLTSLLAENNINIIEMMSCWTDTLFVINENDVSNTMKYLK